MTQETKLGLVIGGAFILCFSLILSNSENDNIVEQQIATLLSSTQDTVDSADLAPSGRIIPTQVHSAVPTFETPIQIEPRSAQLGTRPVQAAYDGGLNADPNELPSSDEKMPAHAEPVFDTGLRQSPPSSTPPSRSRVADAIANRPQTTSNDNVVAASNSSPRKEEQLRGEDSRNGSFEKKEPSPKTSPQQRRQRPQRVQVYVVAKNDNLSKIAKKFYGKASKASVDLIFSSNRKILKDRDSLRVGQELEIPIIGDPKKSRTSIESALAVARLTRPASSSKKVAEGKSSARKRWKWYQVKANDRYTKIAKEQLGNEDRWRDIFELNKKTFPDPNKIRPGVRIKLPT